MKEMQNDIEDPEDGRVSKSERKREMHALQDLAERLADLKPGQWEQFEFSESMRAALEESRRVKGQNAMRRHVRRLGKLLQHEDAEQVRVLFQRIDNEHLADTERFHRLERWRDRLLEEDGEALQELLDVCPNADKQQLRQLIRSAKQEQEHAKPPVNQRKLFRFLRELDIK